MVTDDFSEHNPSPDSSRGGNAMNGKLNTVLKILLIGVMAFVVYAVVNFSREQSINIKEHRMSIETNNQNSKDQLTLAANTNKARADIGLCIFSVSPTRRTPEYVKSCYDLIEKQSGIKVQRFGDGIEAQ